MSKHKAPTITQAMAVLERHGLLMQSDAKLPSVVALVVGKPVRGSWWGHPQGDAIHILNTQLREHPDVIATHLVGRKITYVHRRLWPELFGVATSKEKWQLDGLSRDCRTLFRRVEKHGFIRSDDEALLPTVSSRERRTVIRTLEERLLVHCVEVHTERGTHAKAMQTWARCRRQKKFRRKPLAAPDARERLSAVIKLWSGGSNTNALLPWPLES
ncbi:MAG: hypothetical protein IH987_02315 [Planctomycetes bacterium]|nr:hypothetical protein [Planctomycetota bacterium]